MLMRGSLPESSGTRAEHRPAGTWSRRGGGSGYAARGRHTALSAPRGEGTCRAAVDLHGRTPHHPARPCTSRDQSPTGRTTVDASDLLRNSLLQLSKQDKIRDIIEKAPVS